MGFSTTEFNERFGFYPRSDQRYSGSSAGTVSVSFDFSDLAAHLDDIAAVAEKSVREAAQAGAEHLYYEVRLRAPVSEKEHYFAGTNKRYLFQPGTLRNSIYQVFSKDNSGKGHAEYHIAWNHKECPYGFMVEFGTSRAPAHPFLRPAYDSAKGEATQIVRGVLEGRVREVLQ